MADRIMQDIYRKIEREKQFINSAHTMRQATDNPVMQQRVDTQIRESQRNLGYLEDRMRELQMRKMNQGMENMTVGEGGQQGGAGSQMSPPRQPWVQSNPGAPKSRPNYSKLDLIKYDTPHLGPRIQLMLSQLEFKLSVEKQYKEGIEKMSKLYQIDGDRRSKADAESKRIESNQKIQLLKQALKRYEDLHVDMDTDEPDDDSINSPNIRRPLTGHLHIRVMAVKDVDHATTSRFARGPETFVIIKVEDLARARTKTTRNDKWLDESHDIDVDKANEIEITVYDKPGDHPLPIGMLWIRISDISEEMRKKKIEQDISASGWVSADHVEPGPQYAFSPGGIGAQPGSQGPGGAQQQGVTGADPNQAPTVDAWFALEPVGQIRLALSFVKFNNNKRPLDLGLGRKGAVRQRKEEVHEMYGHKFVQQQFYNIMRCAFCGDFLKYSTGYQCSDCKYTCHKKCYEKVVTKCISKSNHDMDPEEEKLNHRIPHRFEAMTNIGANWCCHCGYMLPIGKKGSKKCTECHLTCHAQCSHLVPDFCGMPMDVANMILTQIRNTKRQQRAPTGPQAAGQGAGGQWPKPQGTPRKDSFLASPQQATPPQPLPSPLEQQAPYIPHQNYQQQSYPASPSIDAAQAAYNSAQQMPQSPTRMSAPQQPFPPPQQQPQYAAAAAALNAKRNTDGYGQPQPGPQYDQRPMSLTTPPSPYGAPPGPPPPQADPYQTAVGPPPQSPQPQMQQKQPLYGEMQQQRPQSQSAYQQQVVPVKQQQPPPQGYGAPVKPAGPPQTQPPQKKIGLDHFNFLAVLGKGNFGKVMLAETKGSRQLYAIKVLKKEFIIEHDEVESTRSEKRVFLIANKERHPFLLNLHACFQTETRVYFVMEYISGGDLMLHIQRGQFGTKRAQFYAAEVCLALKYFHENGVIYRDLKLDNILLTLDGHIKIADYGLCKEEMWYGSTTGTFCGTPEFMAPEILMEKGYGRAVDWWAFGVLIYQMLLQQSPFRGEDEEEIYDAILADEPLYPIHMPRDSVSILQKLLQREPEKRLGSGPTDAQEIMNQPFFANVNWDDVYHKRVPPPFKPTITNPKDTSNFDQEFTSVTPVLTPVQSVLTQAMQEEFRGFSYTADFV